FESDHVLHACEVEPQLRRQVLDESEPVQVGVGVETRVARCALGRDEALRLVDPECLRVHAHELGRDGDHVARPVVHHCSQILLSRRCAASAATPPITSRTRPSTKISPESEPRVHFQAGELPETVSRNQIRYAVAANQTRVPPRIAPLFITDRAFVAHGVFCTFWSSSSSSRSFLFGFLGTAIVSRASTSPLPLPFSFGAPRPLMRKSLPLSEPAGIFSETGPSGVGTSTFAPSAASANVTGTSTSRSAPRPLYTGDSVTLVTTITSPAGPPPQRGSPLPLSRICVPFLTPAGIFTLYRFVRRSRPVP